jgi:Tripartite ATP-independent periplasmic transporters, DctQ component
VEVFKRYILNAPTAWMFDATAMLYGALFMMCGAYTLAQDAHVRGDFLYGSMRPRLQASLDLAQLSGSTYVDEESRKRAIEQVHEIDEAAHQRVGGKGAER